ncbi:Transposable element Tcb1 transposase, partial [Stegodyphus mimosarum]
MVWGGIIFDHKVSLVHINGNLTADRYVTQILEPFVLPWLQGPPNTVFQQDNAKPHVGRRTLNSLTGLGILPWPAASPDQNPIEHLWDVIERDINRGPRQQTLDDLHTALDVA